MEMNDRIRKLRKNYLKLSQAEFGEKLGVSRSVIKNIELNVLARPDQKLSLIKLMCKEFGVSEDWLLHGKGDMFAAKPKDVIDQLREEYSLGDFDASLIREYLKLSEKERDAVQGFFNRVISAMPEEDPLEDIRSADQTMEQLEEEYKKSRSGSAPKTTVSASSSTGDGEAPAANE